MDGGCLRLGTRGSTTSDTPVCSFTSPRLDASRPRSEERRARAVIKLKFLAREGSLP